MPAVCRKDIDYVGPPDVMGTLIGNHAQNVFVNGSIVSVVTDEIIGHKPFGVPHNTAKGASGSPNVFVHGLPVFRVGDAASCGHIATVGSGNVFVN